MEAEEEVNSSDMCLPNPVDMMCPTEPGQRGWVKTAHGSERRVEEADKGYGIKQEKPSCVPKEPCFSTSKS